LSELSADPLDRWLLALEKRHLADLSFAEVRRALQALSSLYVERRERAPLADAFRSAGKRAAYAMFYGPLHYLLIRRIVRELGADSPPPRRIVDLGCGTGAAGAAWALEAGGTPEILGIDRAEWAVGETALAYRALGARGRARRGDLDRFLLPGAADAIVAAYTVNEMEAAARERLLDRLIEAASGGARVLVVEPVSKRAAPWWNEWQEAFALHGGQAHDWRFAANLPGLLHRLDRAAGLDHRELTARSVWLDAAREPSRDK
jgi:SAM-dependent methyltransferase